MFIYIYAHTHIHTYTHKKHKKHNICVFGCAWVYDFCMYICECVCMFVCMCVYACVYVCMCVFQYTQGLQQSITLMIVDLGSLSKNLNFCMLYLCPADAVPLLVERTQVYWNTILWYSIPLYFKKVVGFIEHYSIFTRIVKDFIKFISC